jgi:hypothetical protein
VISRSFSELSQSGNEVNAICFSQSGQVLGIGCNDGESGVLEMEGGSYLKCRTGGSKPADTSMIQAIAWQIPATRGDVHRRESKGGEATIVMVEYSDHSGGHEKDQTLALHSMLAVNADNVMLCLSANGHLRAFSCGIFPLFTIDIIRFIPSVQPSRVPLGCSHSSACLILASLSDVGIAHESIRIHDFQADRYDLHQKFASTFLQIEVDIVTLQDIVVGFARKWKEATKVILPKLSLLQSVMDGYHLGLNPIEFMHSIAICGMWHPAALSSFPSHWNDQGWSRLKSAIDSASLYIVKTLQMKCLPLALNICCRAR